MKSKYSIGVVTYVKRFEQYLKPLVKQLERIFPDIEKNFILNGYFEPKIQQEYLIKAKDFLSKTSANSVISYNEHQGLSKCWNQLILNSQANKILILNDDVSMDRLFRLTLEPQLNFYDNAVINRSWSHFLISKNTIKKVGWFDERFIGVGYEDGDYALRLALAEGKTELPKTYLRSIYCLGLKNLVARNDEPGWKNFSSTTNGKYAQANVDFFMRKWQLSPKPQPGAIKFYNVHYVTLRPGMETPNFYQEIFKI